MRTAHNAFEIVLEEHIALFPRLIEAVTSAETETAKVIAPMLGSLFETALSLRELAMRGFVKDSYTIARSLFEASVNICFIEAGGKEMAERAERHALQKGLRDIQRELDWAHENLGVERRELDLHLSEAVAEFTGRKGREITAWTPETVEQRLKAIGGAFGSGIEKGLRQGLYAIYRHASEVAHGTLYAALYSLGIAAGQTAEAERKALREDRARMVQGISGLTLHLLVKCLAQRYKLSDELADSLKAAHLLA